MRIVRAHLGAAIRYSGSHGDLWTTTWADDGHLYAASDDTTGFGRACSSNLAVHRIVGDIPPDLHGETINGMFEYGGWGEALEDGAMWKACGLESIDGVLYMTVSRHGTPMSSFSIQEAWDATIVKSADHGVTWSAAPALGSSMFPGPSFSTPFFVTYGQDGRASVDGADRYVYAIACSGHWNNGSSMTLGRVPRERLPRLDARDWEFAHGLDGKGLLRWWPRHDTAQHVFRAPGRTSMTGLHHIAPLGLYILPQWHYTHLEDEGRRWGATCVELYQAPAPWGPYSLFHVQHFEPQGWYNPYIPNKFISADGRHLWLLVAGDWTTCHDPEGYYGLHMIPVDLEVEG
ncbi:MAG: hypothetical protein ACYC5M_15345 [Anaerolineae bacterium]